MRSVFTISAKYTVILALGLSLAACSGMPRGAAFQNEVLKSPESREDFQVETVTRSSLDTIALWPKAEPQPLRWLRKQDQPSGALITPGDTLSLTIWDTGDNSLLTTVGDKKADLQGITVSPAGKIFLPYIGTLKVSGMSPEHAREVLEEKLSGIMSSAQVQLLHKPGRKSEVSLVDGVRSPGNYPLRGRDVTLLNAISQAGGVSATLSNPQVHLIRGSQLYGISLDRLTSNPQLDITLRGNDKVIVKNDERYFLSLGAAGKEAVHGFRKDQLSALDAMSIIGGVSDSRADPKGILVLRQYPASALRKDQKGPQKERVVFVVDLTNADGLFSAGRFQVQSGDLIYATESPVTSTRTLFGLISSLFGVASRIDNF